VLIVRLGAMLLWPIFFPSALAMRRVQRQRPRPDGGLTEIFELMSKMSAGGISEDAFPNGHGRFGYDLSHPIPAHTILGAKTYLGELRTLDNRRVSAERIGSFGSDTCERPVDGYRLSSEDGVPLGVIYISLYQARTSQRSPQGLKLFGVAPSATTDNIEAATPTTRPLASPPSIDPNSRAGATSSGGTDQNPKPIKPVAGPSPKANTEAEQTDTPQRIGIALSI
jgi:hypothetical protein